MQLKVIKFMLILLTGAFVLSSALTWAEKAPQEIYDMAENELAAYGKDPVILEAVKAQNAKNISLEDIKKMDEKWLKTPGVADFMEKIMKSECGAHLLKIQSSKPYYSEIFVMDNQGANVAMTNKTSDYWQGDESKFKNSFNGEKGAVFVDAVEFDDSSQAYLVQVSVPVMDNGKAVGAITFGINLDEME